MYIEDNGNMFVESTGNNDRTYTHTAIPLDNSWVFYVATIDWINKVFTIYLNGEEKGEIIDNNTEFLNNNNSLKLATWDETNSSYAPFFHGWLD